MIFLGLFLGLLIYFILKLYYYDGTIKQFFTNKITLLPAILSVVTTITMAIAVDWTAIEMHVKVANVSVLYAYVIAVIIGLGNSTLFFSILKKKAPKADTPLNPPV
jgi:hypothetical protein